IWFCGAGFRSRTGRGREGDKPRAANRSARKESSGRHAFFCAASQSAGCDIVRQKQKSERAAAGVLFRAGGVARESSAAAANEFSREMKLEKSFLPQRRRGAEKESFLPTFSQASASLRLYGSFSVF